jgi:hypothetical protein
VGKGDRLSRDQKRKAKLKKREDRSRKHESLAYHGKKYKTEKYVPILHRTEIGIYESYVMCDRELTDDEVEEALERLIVRMRSKALPLPSATNRLTISGNENDDLIIWNILRNWQILTSRDQLPGRDDLIGILRTILHSLEIWRAQSLHSQGYLQFVEGFMKKTGVAVDLVRPDQVPLLGLPDETMRELGLESIDDGDKE